MKLYYGPNSPYVRMARATALARGIAARIELVNARAPESGFERLNPLNKVPALVTDEGEVLIESRLICRYLDRVAGAPGLYPEDGAALRGTLTREAVVHGVLDAAILRFNEARRPTPERSPAWDARQERKIRLGLDAAEADLAGYTREGTIIPLMLGCAVDFIDHPDWSLVGYDWRKARPGLAAWFAAFSRSPLMVETATIG